MTPAAAARHIDIFHGAPLDVLSSCLRGMLIAAPGHVLMAADFANIEGRGLAWLAGEEWKLRAFREFDAGVGPDLYHVMAGGILGKPVTEITGDERQAFGKVPELACGYGGGVGAGQSMARVYGVTMSDDMMDSAKTKWREKNPRIVQYWYDTEDAAKQAIRHRGIKFEAGPKGRQVVFRVKGSFLWCKTPSNGVLCYPYARLDDGWTYLKPDGKRVKLSGRAMVNTTIPPDWVLERHDRDVLWYMTVNGLTNKWEETDTYGGKIAQNLTEKICRDVLVDAMWKCEAAGYPIVLHVHDELVAEVPEGFGDIRSFEALCSGAPDWAEGLPVVAAGWSGKRYRKG